MKYMRFRSSCSYAAANLPELTGTFRTLQGNLMQFLRGSRESLLADARRAARQHAGPMQVHTREN